MPQQDPGTQKADTASTRGAEPLARGAKPGHVLLLEQPQIAEILNLTHEAIYAVDKSGAIAFWNRGAERLYGWSEQEILGRNAMDVLRTELPLPLADVQRMLRTGNCWEGEVSHTTREGERIVAASRWAPWRGSQAEDLGWFQLEIDISMQKKAEHELRVLSGRLLMLQDEERRRLARDLHDSVGQLLAGAAMTISSLAQKTQQNDEGARSLISETTDLLERALTEIRTISYLLHPPLLDEMGLASALRWYVFGFAERSHIQVDLSVSSNLGRFRHELELAVFRIVQEGLSNVHRHSGSANAKIALSRVGNELRLKIEDRGKGMTPSLAGQSGSQPISSAGVGISGMRERVRQLGGRLQITSGNEGTRLEAIFPLEDTGDAAFAADPE
jgi:PAS domain S-box-containing protein